MDIGKFLDALPKHRNAYLVGITPVLSHIHFNAMLVLKWSVCVPVVRFYGILIWAIMGEPIAVLRVNVRGATDQCADKYP